VTDRWYAVLNASVTSGATSWILASSGATGLNPNSIIHCESEKVLVTDIAVDTPTAGLDTLTVERGFGGTTAAAHDPAGGASNGVCANFYYKEYHEEMRARQMALEAHEWYARGAQNGIYRNSFAAAQTDPVSLSVDVSGGGGFVSGQPIGTMTTQQVTVVAPVTNPRIDLIYVDQLGVIAVQTGTEAASPVAPAAPTDTLGLWQIYNTTAQTSIKDTDDATNGYLTDVRAYI
jgi:hypothetical protein